VHRRGTRAGGPTGADRIEEETEGGKGGRDIGSLLAAISSYAPAPIYPPALRISHHGSLSLSLSLSLQLPRTATRRFPPSSLLPPSPTYFISDANDNVFGIYRQQPSVLHRSYVSRLIQTQGLQSVMMEVERMV